MWLTRNKTKSFCLGTLHIKYPLKKKKHTKYKYKKHFTAGGNTAEATVLDKGFFFFFWLSFFVCGIAVGFHENEKRFTKMLQSTLYSQEVNLHYKKYIRQNMDKDGLKIWQVFF